MMGHGIFVSPELTDVIRHNFERTGKSGIRTFHRSRYKRQGLLFLPDWSRWFGNIFHDEGEEWVCKVVFSGAQAVPANYYLGLDNRTTPAEGNSLTDLSGEPSGNGYGRSAIASDATDFTVSQDSGDWQAKTKQVTFTASGGAWTAVQQLWITDASTGTSGKLIATAALSASRTLQDGDSLDADLAIKVKEAA